ncbi:DNA polymerase III subunit delta [Deinococcus sonorensis]|uniref:DNA-directed DNA polymerase n=2 Tax=Deinococcus sonorensis TaxID=309891 RepID=A0AAU7UC19_9DEIO
MILGFSGNHFLAEEKAREVMQARGLPLRDLPRIGGDDVRLETLAPLLAPSLFGEAALLLDLEGVKVPAGVMDLLARSGATVAVLDATPAASRLKLYEKPGVGEHFPSPAPSKPGEVQGWVTARARQLGLKLDRDAAQYLAEVFGTDLAGMAAELNKLSLLDGPLNREAVQRVVGREPPGDSFAMLGAATSGRPGEALLQLRRLLASGEDPFRLMGAVVWQYSLVARCVALQQESGGPVSEAVAAQRLNVKPYPAKKALEVARRLNEPRIRAQLGRILDADQAMKSGQDAGAVMERLIVQLSV